MPLDLQSNIPLADNVKSPQYEQQIQPAFEQLQGNILKGHGRDFAANIFLQFTGDAEQARAVIQGLSGCVTSMHKQLLETYEFNSLNIPGSIFGNLFLTAAGYKQLGFSDELLKTLFSEEGNGAAPLPENSAFVTGMHEAAADLGDTTAAAAADGGALLEAYRTEAIHALLLLADDDKLHLLRRVRELVSGFTQQAVTVLAVELGEALRNNEEEGIEHFGYVDGRSQPLFLASDFENLSPTTGGFTPTSRERVSEKHKHKDSGAIDIWNPFAKLELALVRDPVVADEDCYGSYYVFRKLEQDVMRFSMEEQLLADDLKLKGPDRERAGAMAVGRFRDGTPLTTSPVDGFLPEKANNFRYDDLDADLKAIPGRASDKDGFRCPFHAHIRKTNPREVGKFQGISPLDEDNGDKARRIVRRGIPYGTRERHPNAFQALDDLPTKDVGLLFACFQQSIPHQFAFMQKTWANNLSFKTDKPDLVGLDPLIGQVLAGQSTGKGQSWPTVYDDPTAPKQQFHFDRFITFKGGEFFFAPSMSFLSNPVVPVVPPAAAIANAGQD